MFAVITGPRLSATQVAHSMINGTQALYRGWICNHKKLVGVNQTKFEILVSFLQTPLLVSM